MSIDSLPKYPIPDPPFLDEHELELVMEQLSLRQIAILAWISDGKTNPEISMILELGRNTIDREIRQIFQSLGVENRHAASARYLQWKMIERQLHHGGDIAAQ